MYATLCILHTVYVRTYGALCAVHFALYILHCALSTVNFTLCTVLFALYSAVYTYTVQRSWVSSVCITYSKCACHSAKWTPKHFKLRIVWSLQRAPHTLCSSTRSGGLAMEGQCIATSAARFWFQWQFKITRMTLKYVLSHSLLLLFKIHWCHLQGNSFLRGLARLCLDVSLKALKKMFPNFLKRYWPYVWYVDKADTHSLQDV